MKAIPFYVHCLLWLSFLILGIVELAQSQIIMSAGAFAMGLAFYRFQNISFAIHSPDPNLFLRHALDHRIIYSLSITLCSMLFQCDLIKQVFVSFLLP